ncbi:MAG: hypothetical protein ACREMD_13985 [Gemmatimonadota bacterium]
MSAGPNPPTRSVTISLAPGRVALLLVIGILALAAANVLAGFYQVFTGADVPTLIDVSEECNIPTWYNSALLALAGGLAALVGRADRGREGARPKYWWGMALAMFLVSMDEVAAVHERIDALVPPRLVEPFGEWITVHPWVIFGLPAVLLLGALYVPFLRALPDRTRRFFLLAAAAYVGGAIGAESLHGAINVYYGGGVFTSLAILLEESLEMTGVVIFIYGLLDHLRRI